MKVAKKTSVGGSWAKPGQDIKDQDRVKIMDAGQIVSGDYGDRHVFQILTTSKEEFNLSFNQTSMNNLIDAFGSDTEGWKDKVVRAFIIKQRVGDGLKNVLYLAPENWTMDEDGRFVNPKIEVPDVGDGIDPDDIPF